MDGKNDEIFQYTYSAAQQEEVKRIRDKYAPPGQTEDKMERLRRLDRSVTRPGVIAALTLGIVSTLVLGVGMSFVLVYDELFIPGILIGFAGILGMLAAWPVYTLITRKRRKKLAPEILRLTDELLGQG